MIIKRPDQRAYFDAPSWQRRTLSNGLPLHFMVSACDGGLYDTRRGNWARRPVRAVYEKVCELIDDTHQLRATLRAGPYAWPGGYGLAFLTDDGALLSYRAVRENYRSVSSAVRHKYRDGWRVVGVVVGEREGDDGYPEYCAHDGGPLWGAG